MNRCLVSRMRRQAAAVGLAVAAVALLASDGADAANFATLSRDPTPLVLKDGRIAKVSVHIVPFENGSAELSAADRSTLMRMLVPMATDCFLTAQAVGHVEATDGDENETMATHRLARARAEQVQKEMIALGLPEASIASVWDWQFLVRDARVTLWVFQLVRGEECEGRQLEEARMIAASLPKSDPRSRAHRLPPPRRPSKRRSSRHLRARLRARSRCRPASARICRRAHRRRRNTPWRESLRQAPRRAMRPQPARLSSTQPTRRRQVRQTGSRRPSRPLKRRKSPRSNPIGAAQRRKIRRRTQAINPSC